MTTKTNERLTKKYVDEAVDAQRQYAETLFGKSEGRVKVILDDMIDKKLKDALAIMRPTPASGCKDSVEVRQVSLRQVNEEMIRLIKVQLVKIAQTYYTYSGIQLECAEFNFNTVNSPTVHIKAVHGPVI